MGDILFPSLDNFEDHRRQKGVKMSVFVCQGKPCLLIDMFLFSYDKKKGNCTLLNEPHHQKTSMCFLYMSDTNRVVQAQKMAGVKLEELYYPCSNNKSADQLLLRS